MRRLRSDKYRFRIENQREVTYVSLLVAAYGIYILADTLVNRVVTLHHVHFHSFGSFDIDLLLLLGISVIYLSTLLRRRKRTAWVVTVGAYTFYLGFGILQLISHFSFNHNHWFIDLLKNLILPLLILILLVKTESDFVVKSDIRGFRASLRFIVIILAITLLYGVSGFMLLDNSDFHQEINFGSAVHYTIDQFNLTTSRPVEPYTKRATLFVDSLSFVSTVSVIYAAVSLFQPFRARFSDQSSNRRKVEELLNKYGAQSEEFFKLWPHDKLYFFDDSGESALAFHVYRGVALCLSDPIGNEARFLPLMAGFLNLCFSNDWLPSLVHVSDKYTDLYEKSGFAMQRLGQEAVVNIDHFQANLRNSKYFRQIMNKFKNQGYSYDLLSPPHHKAVSERFKVISDEWLSKGGRSERGFAMGYYTEEYVQMCQMAVARDAAGTIQAFMNLVPAASFDSEEATYDMIRQTNKALSNVVDYLIINVMEALQKDGYKRFNMGLSPLAGLDETESEERTILDNVLKFAYANGDAFFSFSGLNKFKSKYEPEWQDKYLGFKGGIRGFSRSMTALTRCMSKVVRLPRS